MTTTPPIFPPDALQRIVVESTKKAVSILQSILTAMWASYRPYLPYAIGVLFLVMLVAMVKAMFGQTGLLGSLIYHIFFFGIMGAVIVIYGLEVLFNPFFEIISVTAYGISYLTTGMILRRLKR